MAINTIAKERATPMFTSYDCDNVIRMINMHAVQSGLTVTRKQIVPLVQRAFAPYLTFTGTNNRDELMDDIMQMIWIRPELQVPTIANQILQKLKELFGFAA